MTPETVQQIAEAIQQAQNITFAPSQCQSVSGGDINQSYLLSDGEQRFFVKTNDKQHATMLDAEQVALTAIAQALAHPQAQAGAPSHELHVPQPVTTGVAGSLAYLVLEYLPLASGGDSGSLAAGLVTLHRSTAPNNRYGWDTDNFIGTSPQHNGWSSHWVEFWRERRLQPQLEMAYRAGYSELQSLAEPLFDRLPEILADHDPQPSLLHGDLWGGNAGYLKNGQPVIYDPASYYGDRETDLAMTELFGGFGPDFQQEYRRLWPLEPGYDLRKRLYNLYHLLNHLNLFGRGYLGQCQSTMKALIGSV